MPSQTHKGQQNLLRDGRQIGCKKGQIQRNMRDCYVWEEFKALAGKISKKIRDILGTFLCTILAKIRDMA